MMPLQRARGAEMRVRNKLSNGPLRVQSNGLSQSILQRVGIRQLPGICWYPDKGTVQTVKQGGTADKVYRKVCYSSLMEVGFCRGLFYLPRRRLVCFCWSDDGDGEIRPICVRLYRRRSPQYFIFKYKVND